VVLDEFESILLAIGVDHGILAGAWSSMQNQKAAPATLFCDFDKLLYFLFVHDQVIDGLRRMFLYPKSVVTCYVLIGRLRTIVAFCRSHLVYNALL